MRSHIVDICQVRHDNLEVARNNAWDEFIAAIKAQTEATRLVNEKHEAWMKLCPKATP